MPGRSALQQRVLHCNLWLSLLTGLPPESDITHCPEEGTSCYFVQNTAKTWQDAASRCFSNFRNGTLVNWNTAEEQLAIEQRWGHMHATRPNHLHIG